MILKWNQNIIIYVYIYSPRPQTMDDIYWLWYCLDYWLIWNLVNIMNGWFEMIDFGWNPNRISIWENSSAYELDIENPHCQKLRSFKEERGAVLGTVLVLTTLPLCCWNFLKYNCVWFKFRCWKKNSCDEIVTTWIFGHFTLDI